MKFLSFFASFAAIILAILYLRQCGQVKYEKKKASQNQQALTDSIETMKLKNGELITQKATFVADAKELEKLNASLYAEYETLKKEKSKPKVIIKSKIVYVDSGEVNNVLSQLLKNKYSLNFDYKGSDSIISIVGRSEFKAFPKYNSDDLTKFKLDIRPGKTYFDSIRVSLGVTLGIKEDRDGVDRVFVKPYPFTDKIQFTDVNAVQLEDYYKSKYNKNKKKFTVGPYVGLGVVMGTNGQIQLKPQIGLGVQYSIFKF